MNETLQAVMLAATELTRAGRLTEATAAIQRALRGGLDTSQPAGPDRPTAPLLPGADVLDGCVFEVAALEPDTSVSNSERADAPQTSPERKAAIGSGHFTPGTYQEGPQSRDYKLFTPPGAPGVHLPLVVMLHGCTQNPDDFAAGTAMNEQARKRGFFVLYPAQSQGANPQRCWNWFKHNHQKRGSGEPALIAGMTRAVMAEHGIDARRVYIAGLSAGGAMAAIVAEAYPDIFAAVGVHSGLPAGAATNVSEALTAMTSGAPGAGSGRPATLRQGAERPVATIVFHGDQDRTVHPKNGEQVLAAALGTAEGSEPRVEQGVSNRGRRYTRSTHAGDRGESVAEHWLVHGAGHAWSGGDAAGSYTDVSGPDATGEMLRFFFEHPHAAPR